MRLLHFAAALQVADTTLSLKLSTVVTVVTVAADTDWASATTAIGRVATADSLVGGLPKRRRTLASMALTPESQLVTKSGRECARLPKEASTAAVTRADSR